MTINHGACDKTSIPTNQKFDIIVSFSFVPGEQTQTIEERHHSNEKSESEETRKHRFVGIATIGYGLVSFPKLDIWSAKPCSINGTISSILHPDQFMIRISKVIVKFEI